MIVVTVSEDGLTSFTNGGEQPCLTVQDVDHSRMYGDRSAGIATLTMTREQAIAVMDDIARQIDYSVDQA